MSLRLEAALRGNLKTFLADEMKAGERAIGTVIRRRTDRLKRDVRSAVTGAGLGQRLGNTIRGRFFPNKGLNAKGRVESAAIYKRPGGLVDLITVFQEGAVITARGGQYLAIPVGAGKKESLRKFDSKSIEMIPFRNGQGYVVVRRGSRAHGRGGGGILFLLVKVARIKRRLNLDSVIAAAESGLDQEIVSEWESIGSASALE